jgi:hypothetical protein
MQPDMTKRLIGTIWKLHTLRICDAVGSKRGNSVTWWWQKYRDQHHCGEAVEI